MSYLTQTSKSLTYIFQNICEGKKDIDARIDAPCLVTLALNTIGLKIEAFAPGFPWQQDKFIVRDGAWVDLATHTADVPYFYSQCLHPSRKVLVLWYSRQDSLWCQLLYPWLSGTTMNHGSIRLKRFVFAI